MKIKTNISKISVENKVAMGRRVFIAMTENPAFTSLQPLITDLGSETDTLEESAQAAQAARQTCAEMFALQDNATAAWDGKVGLLAAAVEQVSLGSTPVILSSGFEVRNPPSPIGPLPAPLNLEAVTNGHQGQVKFRWKHVRGADSYEVQSSSEPTNPVSWLNRAFVSSARTTLEGLPSVTRQWFRVRAIGTAGPSGWGEPAVKTVP
jgi:hypothetical protein